MVIIGLKGKHCSNGCRVTCLLSCLCAWWSFELILTTELHVACALRTFSISWNECGEQGSLPACINVAILILHQKLYVQHFFNGVCLQSYLPYRVMVAHTEALGLQRDKSVRRIHCAILWNVLKGCLKDPFLLLAKLVPWLWFCAFSFSYCLKKSLGELWLWSLLYTPLWSAMYVLPTRYPSCVPTTVDTLWNINLTSLSFLFLLCFFSCSKTGPQLCW